ncbi:MAG: hypothetical protein ACE149_16485 [Armatimonadota bacterium]
MGLHVTVQGADSTTSEALQEQAVLVGAPSVAVSFAQQAALGVQVQGGGVAVAVLAPGYSEELVGAQYLNDLLDVQAAPQDRSLLQYSEAERQWIAGLRMVFRPALKCYLISDGG